MRLIIILLFCSINSFAQQKVRPGLWFGPMNNVKVHGLNISPIVFKLAENSTINGINIEGIGIPFFLFMIPMDPNDNIHTYKPSRKFNINGISASPCGLIHEGKLNGLSITPYMSWIDEVNGVSANIFVTIIAKCNGLMISAYWNSAYKINGLQLAAINKARKIKGIQIGIHNRTDKLKGFQIGLWNVNSKRKLPIINWNFKDDF